MVYTIKTKKTQKKGEKRVKLNIESNHKMHFFLNNVFLQI